jgi:hypothetical protein
MLMWLLTKHNSRDLSSSGQGPIAGSCEVGNEASRSKTGPFPEGKRRPGRNADRLPPSRAEVRACTETALLSAKIFYHMVAWRTRLECRCIPKSTSFRLFYGEELLVPLNPQRWRQLLIWYTRGYVLYADSSNRNLRTCRAMGTRDQLETPVYCVPWKLFRNNLTNLPIFNVLLSFVL